VAAALGLLVALVMGLAVTSSVTATAADPTPAPITDFLHYPDGIAGLVPAGCDGTNVLAGVDFAVGGVHHASLFDFTLHAGDVVTMTWTGFGEGCDAAGISLSAKRAFDNFFDPNDNQHLLLPFSYCGPGGAACAGSLTLTVPAANVACNFQIDAVLGPPLNNIGPNGSYYGSALRKQTGKPYGDGTNMLISANNGGQSHCNLPPEPSTKLSCAHGGLDVSVINPDNLDDITVSITKDGTPVVTDQPVVHGGGTYATTVPMADHVPTHIVVTALVDGVNTSLFDDTVTLDCTHPEATVVVRCADGELPTGVVVTLTNPGAELDATFTVTTVNSPGALQVVKVAPDGTETIVIPATEGHPIHVTVTADGQTAALYDATVTANCVDAHATITHTCASGGATVELTNPDGQSPAKFTITVDGVQLGGVVEVPAGGTQSVAIPVTEDKTSTISVTEATTGDALLATETFTQDCVKPAVTITLSCEKGATLAFTNTGELPVTLTVTKGGTVIDTVTVPAGGSISKDYALAEDETATFRVTGSGFDSGNLAATHDCTTVLPFETTRPAALPRTGASIEPMLLLAGLLLAFGGMFVALGSGLVPALASSKRNQR